MRAYVGVTDGRWYRFLAARPERDGSQFLASGGGHAFRALEPGEPFFFKTHYPHNRIVAAVFSAGSCPCGFRRRGNCWAGETARPAWRRLRAQIGRYRKAPIGAAKTRRSAACFCATPAFFPGATAAPPPGFAGNIVQGKGYDLAEQPGGAVLRRAAPTAHRRAGGTRPG